MNIENFNFELPQELIAQYPNKVRGNSRLLHLQNDNIQHRKFTDIIDLVDYGDVIVFNDTKVINALISGYKIVNNNKKYFNFNLLKEIDNNIWQAIVAKDTWYNDDVFAKNLLINDIIYYYDDLSAIIKEINEKEYYIILEFNKDKEQLFSIIQNNGKIPLPPYIHRDIDESDNSRYQTVFAKNYGAVAAPTAGLHFTDDIINNLKAKGVKIAYITLHVGAGTFFPVTTEDINNHKMHSENFSISKENTEIINNAKLEGKKIIAVGTTSLRCLESSVDENNFISARNCKTDIFIRPGYDFKIVDKLITNFHTPKSTLMILVSAFSGFDNIRKLYNEAIKHKYLFYSYGDACMIEKKQN